MLGLESASLDHIETNPNQKSSSRFKNPAVVVSYDIKQSRSVGNDFIHIDEFIDNYWNQNVIKKELVKNKEIDEVVHKLVH